MKTLTFLMVFSLIFSIETFARSVDISADQFVKKGIPYCSRKITRGCVKPKAGNTAKYYLAPKYKDKKQIAKVKTKLKTKSKAKKVAKNSSPSNYHKTKQSKRDIASLLEKKLKNHSKKKSKKK